VTAIVVSPVPLTGVAVTLHAVAAHLLPELHRDDPVVSPQPGVRRPSCPPIVA